MLPNVRCFPRSCDAVLVAFLAEDLLVALAEERLPPPPAVPLFTADTVRPPASFAREAA